MRRLVERVRGELRGFVEQREDLLCLVSCADADAPIVAKLLEEVEQSSDTDLFLIFPDPFDDPEAYVAACVARMSEQRRLANDVLAGQGKPPLPSLPADLDDPGRRPVERLFDAIQFARSLLPEGGTQRLVWALCPTAIADRSAYLDLVGSLAPYKGLEPWMRRLRLVARDETGSADYAPELAGCARVRVLPVDLGPDAMQDALEGEAQDESLPDEERYQALLQLAALDAAHERYEDAGRKYEILLGHYQATGDFAMQAFVLNAFGEMYHRAEDLEGAQHWYECAAEPAAQGKNEVVLAIVTKNLGDVSYGLQRYKDAAEYYGNLDSLAGHMLQPETKLIALEWRGLSFEQAGDLEAAAESWENAAKFCRTMGLDDPLRVHLGHLERVYGAMGWNSRAVAVRRELDELPGEGGA